MTERVHERPLVVLLGPTASGKTGLALEAAAASGASILSMDSMLVYRGMDVGTAKPTPQERARVPHHLIDLVGPEERYDVQRYLADFGEADATVAAEGGRALVVGGTGFYLQALVHGVFDGPPVDADVRARLEARAEAEGSPALHAELSGVDAASADRIHPNDRKRVVRALEVWEQTGRPLSDWQTEWGWTGEERPGRPRRLIGLRRPEADLDARIGARTRAMLDAGWVEEARRIRDGSGFGPTAIQALGYREALAVADGQLTRDEAEERIAQRTRRFARKQGTWLRRFPEIEWVDAKAPSALLVQSVRAALAGAGPG
jgi:tRNA dimethylallyltransferase